MEKDTMEKMRFFNFNKDNTYVSLKNEYEKYEELFDNMISGEGMVGEKSYLVLWKKEDIEELNNDYAVQEFLNNIILIGSDGADTAYGRNIKGSYIEVPFIGMDDSEVKIIGNTFDEFIEYLYKSE